MTAFDQGKWWTPIRDFDENTLLALTSDIPLSHQEDHLNSALALAVDNRRPQSAEFFLNSPHLKWHPKPTPTMLGKLLRHDSVGMVQQLLRFFPKEPIIINWIGRPTGMLEIAYSGSAYKSVELLLSPPYLPYIDIKSNNHECLLMFLEDNDPRALPLLPEVLKHYTPEELMQALLMERGYVSKAFGVHVARGLEVLSPSEQQQVVPVLTSHKRWDDLSDNPYISSVVTKSILTQEVAAGQQTKTSRKL